jgi:predicted nucleotidyltransferase
LEYAAYAVDRIGEEAVRKQPFTLEELRRHYRDAILEIARRHKATNVRVFGSVARGENTGESDIDFLVDFEAAATLWDQIGLWQDLTELIGREVDLSVEKNLREEFRNDILRDATSL